MWKQYWNTLSHRSNWLRFTWQDNLSQNHVQTFYNTLNHFLIGMFRQRNTLLEIKPRCLNLVFGLENQVESVNAWRQVTRQSGGLDVEKGFRTWVPPGTRAEGAALRQVSWPVPWHESADLGRIGSPPHGCRGSKRCDGLQWGGLARAES